MTARTRYPTRRWCAALIVLFLYPAPLNAQQGPALSPRDQTYQAAVEAAKRGPGRRGTPQGQAPRVTGAGAGAQDPPFRFTQMPPQRSPGEDDYHYDVRIAAYINAILININKRYFSDAVPKRRVDIALMRETDVKRREGLQELRDKWKARGRGPEFDRDYQRTAATPNLLPQQGAVRGQVREIPNPLAAPAPTPPPLPQAHWWERIAQATASTPFSTPDFSLVFAILLTTLLSPFVLFAHHPFLMSFALLVLYVVFRRRKYAGPRPLSDTYGSAHYAGLETDIADERLLSKGLFLGKSSAPAYASAPLNAPGAPVCSTPEHHTLIVAQTRTGKGTRVIVPTLLRYGGSALVIDPKGENAAITATTRKAQLGQDIHILNPWNQLGDTYRRKGFATATYNPLDILDRDDPNVVAIAQTLAGAICPPPPSGKDAYWQSNAANILTAIFLWLAYQPEKKTLARTRELIGLSRKEFTAKFVVPMSVTDAFGGAIKEMASQFLDLAPETYSGVMSNLNQSTQFLSDPQIKAATAESSFSMTDLTAGRTTVYLVIPPERMDTQRTWLRLVISAAMHTFKCPAHGRLNSGHRCLFLIDEFPALGHLHEVPKDIATMSGYGVDFALVIQGLDQLKSNYEKSDATILSNCAYKWFCNVGDLESAKYLSDTLGKATVGTVSTSESFNPGGAGSSVSMGETGRPLLTPDEILNLGRNVAICIQPNAHPHYLRPVDYWELPQAFSGLKGKHPGLYWNPALTFDENPYRPKNKSGTDGRDKSQGKRKAEADVDGMQMSEKRAREILEVQPEAGVEEIVAAYKRLIVKFHPDVGGSNYLAKEINAAKAFLLGE